MRLSPRLLSLVAGSAASVASVAGCGGTVQSLPRAETPPSTVPAPRVAVTPRVTPSTTNANAPSEPVITTVGTSTEPMNPEDYPVDCGRG